jgi:hypothetical protein
MPIPPAERADHDPDGDDRRKIDPSQMAVSSGRLAARLRQSTSKKVDTD